MITTKTIAALGIGLIMILSVIGSVLVDFGPNEEEQEYNGFEFIQLPRGWQTKINGEKILFNYYPSQLEDITAPSEASAILQNTPIIAVTYNPNTRWAHDLAELHYYVEQTLTSETRYILRGISDNTAHPTLPQITCTNASTTLPVILFNPPVNITNTTITFNNSCITINPTRTEDLYRATDKLLYLILGVMPQ